MFIDSTKQKGRNSMLEASEDNSERLWEDGDFCLCKGKQVTTVAADTET